jgi:hypothetical protein
LRKILVAESGDPANNFGIVMQDLGRLDEAIASYDVAIALKQAQSEGLTVAFRGAGRSYGDASIKGFEAQSTGKLLHYRLAIKCLGDSIP